MSRQAAGMWAWALQRATGVYIALFVIYLAVLFTFAAPADYTAWHATLGSPVVTITAMLFFLAVLLHAWVGMRDIAIDYLWHTGVRLAALTVIALILLGCGVWVTKILLLTVHS